MLLSSAASVLAAVRYVDVNSASNTPPFASQQASRGGYQDAQDQPEVSSALRSEVLAATPGANVLLNMGNNEPTIAADPNNPLHVAVATFLGIRVSTDGGVTFEPRVSITAPAGYSTARGGDSSLGYDSQGRLFWTFLLLNTNVGGFDVFLVQCDPSIGAILPGYPVNVTVAAGVVADYFNHDHDKPWLAVDASSTSPFRDRLHVVWTDFSSSGTVIRTTSSANQGTTWTPALALSGTGEGSVWPAQNTVAPNGDVYASYHSQTGFQGSNPDGTSGKVFVLRSLNGGATYPQKRLAYAAGRADITWNVQSGTRKIPRTQFWLQGSVQPQILADPNIPRRIYIIANDQPNPTDFADVYIATSINNGNTWSAPARIDRGAPGTFQVMPSAAIDPVTGCIVVTYYDNRNGQTNSSGNFLLDLFATTSADGGATFTPDFQINTAAFDPDLNARCRFGPSGCGDYDTVRTLRIGEYNGVAVAGGVALTVWTGNNASGFQDTVFNLFSGCVACTLNCPATVTQANDPGLCGATVNYPAPATSGGCGIVTCSPAPSSFFALGTNTVTCTGATGSSCTFNVIVNDTEPPKINCPLDITAEFTSIDGVPVSFPPPVVTDNCPGAAAACVPPSGSTFPIATNTVTCIATDGSGNSTPCSFTVIVLGALGVKQNVLAELITLRSTVTDKEDTHKLDEAIHELTESLEPSLWVDQTHVERKHGDKVFQEEKKAVHELVELLKDKKSSIPDALLQGFIDRILRADRLLTVVAVDEAEAAGVKPKKIAEDREEIDKGDEDAADGKYEEAIAHYRNAWKHAVHLKVQPPHRLANGASRLEFLAIEGETYLIQVSTNLIDWVTLGTARANAEGVIEFDDVSASQYSTRFYRVLEPELTTP